MGTSTGRAYVYRDEDYLKLKIIAGFLSSLLKMPISIHTLLRRPIFILFMVGALFSLISLKYFPYPYIWISVQWLFIFGILTSVSNETIQKSIWFNLAFTILVFGAIEGYSYSSLPNKSNFERMEGQYTRGGYFTRNEILGYAPTPAIQVTAKKYFGQQLLYDVSYTINNFGLRISSSSEPLHNNQSVLFFGGSYTFGEGVEDYETMPYIVKKLSNYQVYNFGFHGYGPHQMLSAIQHGMVEDIVNSQPRIVICQFSLFHVSRSAGFSSWDKHGPKYDLQSNGSLSYAGHFDDDGWVHEKGKIMQQLSKSYTYKKYFERRGEVNEKNVKLFIEIISYSQNLLKKLYPEVEFHLIYWEENPDNKFDEMIIESLKSKGVNIHSITQILPDYSSDRSRYEINYDAHPNSVAHQHIAQYIVNRIINKNRPNIH